ncbi:MAG: hypothetical protein JWO78_2069 [Micavibrio sp.]|nr:hypothetical protein [Micavibrio sp.]
MTDINQLSTGAKVTKTAADIATIGLSFAFAAAACRTGPYAGGAAAAAVTLPVLYSMMGVVFRHLGQPENPFVHEISRQTGLQITAGALKNIFADVKSAAIATAILGFVGLTAGVLVSETEKSSERAEALRNRMTLPGDTLIRAKGLCNQQTRYSYVIPYTHEGRQYKIVCP